jgi:hypothetical protein
MDEIIAIYPERALQTSSAEPVRGKAGPEGVAAKTISPSSTSAIIKQIGDPRGGFAEGVVGKRLLYEKVLRAGEYVWA